MLLSSARSRYPKVMPTCAKMPLELIPGTRGIIKSITHL